MIKLGDRDDDLKMAEARNELDWAKTIKVALDPQKACRYGKNERPQMQTPVLCVVILRL